MAHSTLPIATLIPIATLALACTEPRTTETPDAAEALAESGSLPTPVRPEPAAIAADQAVVVAQLDVPSPSAWRMEPGGTRVAAIHASECGVWQLGSGDYLGPASGGEPCETWTPLEPLAFADGSTGLALIHPDGERQLAVMADRFTLGGSRPIEGRLRGDRRYRAAAFSPDGARLALFVGAARGAQQIEIWNLGEGRRERELAFAGQAESLAAGYWLRWDERSLAAIVHFEPEPCDTDVDPECEGWAGPGWRDLDVVQTWSTLADPPTRVMLPAYEGERVEALFADPDHRWLFALLEVMEPREGTGFTVAEIPLHEGQAETGLHWYANTLEGSVAPLDTGKVRHWSNLVGSTFVETHEYSSSYSVGTWVNWSITSLTPIPDAPVEIEFGEGGLISTEDGAYAWKVVAAGRDRLLGDTDVCPSSWAIEEAKDAGEPPPACEQLRVAPEGCAVVDASWSFDRLLLACSDRWWLAPTPALGVTVDLGSARELGLGTGEPRQVVWGPRGLAIWTFAEGLRSFEGEQLAATHTGVIDLHRAVLDEELDLALVRERGGLRVADLRSDELGPTLTWTDRVEFAAFAPDRSQLAVAGEGELAVFLRGESQPVARWRTGKLAGLAFRQDGEVLYVGATRPLPELALDPTSGAQVESAQLDRVAFERIAAAELDPSWRWAIEEDGTIVRTIDGQALELLDRDRAVAESGWFVGDPSTLDGYRMHIGPSSPAPVYAPAELAGQLQRPNLIAEFFAGEPLPRPRVTPPQPAGSR